MTDYLKLAQEMPAEQPPTDNPYLSIAQDEQRQQQTLARTVIESALKDNPDAAAERQRLAKTSGLPLRVIERNLDEVRLKEQARAIDLVKMAQDSPVLARQLTDPSFTTLAVDDVDTLTEIERSVGHAVRYMMGAAPGGGVVGDLKASLYRSAGAIAGAKMAAVDVVEPWARLVAGDDNWFAGMSRYYADQVRANDAVVESLSPRTGSTIGDGVSSGVQSFGQNAKYLPLALAGPGGAALALGGMVMESFGASYGKAADKNLPLWQKLGYASADAMVEYWTEKIPMDALIGGIRQGAPFIQVLAKQMALEIPGEQLATVLQDLNEWATLNPGKPFADYLKERPDAAAQTLIATVIGTGGNVAVTSGVAKIADSIAGPAWRDNLTTTYADMLAQQLKLAGQSALRGRSPEQFRAHVQRVVDSAEAASKSVWVDGQVLNQLPEEVLNQLPEGVRAQIADAAASGDTVEIPMADVLTVAPGTPLEQVLNEHARLDPFAASRAEVAAAQDVLKQEAARVIQEAADAQVAQQEFDTVKAMYAEQITATGRYRPAVAEQMGTWIASFYTAYGSRVGMTPTQFQQRYPVRVAGVPSGQGTVLNGGGQPGRIDGVEAYHYSMAPRAVLSSSAYGTGLRGSARDEIMAHPDKRLRHRISFYVDKGTGVRPEAGVGGVAHRVNLDNIYDANADPLRLRSGDARAFETRVLDAGFSGYLDRLDGDQPGQVILLGEQNVTPEVLGPVGRIEAGKKLPALQRKAAQWKTQASGTPEMLQARLERMQASSAWQNYDIRIEGNELQVREKDGVFEQSGRDGGDTTYADKARALLDSRPAPVLSTVALMDGKEEAPRFKTITDLAAHFTKKNRGKARDLSDPKVQAKIADALYAEALHGLTDAGNAIGWYDRKTKAALDIITEAHPELATDEQARFAFIAILAVTSNGLRSRDNFVIAERLYRENWKTDKRFPETVPDGGPRSNQMGEALALLNRKIDELDWQAVRDFMESKHTAKEVRDFAGANSFFGEQAAAEVPGALFLGPKLGSFFNNLYGDFSTVTMDRWFMRTVNRIRGNMLSLPASFTKNLGVLRQQIEAGADTFGVKSEKILAEIAAFEMARPEQQADVLFARSKLKAVQQYARARHREFARLKDDGTGKKRSFLDRTPENYLAKGIDLAMSGSNDAPSSASDRTWIRGVIDQVQARFAKDGIEISNADLQAVLWYYEKDLYAKLISRGGQDVQLEEDAEPKEAEDYETAARYAVGRLRGTGVLAGPAGPARPGDAGRGTGDAGTLAQDGVDPGGSQVNIGLADPNGGPNLDPEIVLRALDVIGAEVQDSNVQVSDSEPTLVAKLKQALTPEQGNLLSRVLDQEAVAQQRAQKAGDLFGPMADKWGPFNPQFFVTMTGERGVNVLWQNPQQPRGTFNPATLELVLNPNANLSTWFHETGHFFLEVMADIASQPGAPAQIVEDFGTFLKWAGITGDEDVGGADSGVPLGQQAEDADAVYQEIAADQEMIDALEVYMVSGDPPEGALNDKLVAYLRRLPPVPADSYLTFYRNQPRGVRAWGRGWASWTTNEDQTRFFGGRDFEVLKRKGAQGINLERLGEARGRITGDYHQYGSQAEWLLLNESVGLNQDGQPTPATQPLPKRRTPLETWNAMTLDQKRPYHERWAESIEQYVMEGKAPSVELQPLMRRFAAWLKSVYGSIQKFLGGKPDAEQTPLNDDIRRVMDHMLATDEQIAQAEEVAGMVPSDEATAEAAEKLRKRGMRDLAWSVKTRDEVIKQLQKQARAVAKAVREAVTAEVDQMPEVRAKAALDALNVDVEYDGALATRKTERAAAEAAAKAEITEHLVAAEEAKGEPLKGLKKGQFLAKVKTEISNKVEARMIEWERANRKPTKAKYATEQDLATIADSFGFEGVDAMLQAIDAFDRRDLVEGMTDQRMLEEHGDLVDERAIQQAANEAVHTLARQRMLASELRTQAELLNERTDTGEVNAKGQRITVNALVEAAKQFGASVVGRTPLRDLKAKAWQHTAAERRASKRYTEMTAKGKTQEAVEAKRDQVLQNAAAKAALDAQAEARKILDFFARVTKGNDETVVEKGRDPDIVNAARAVLAAYGVQTPTTKRAAEYLDVLKTNDPEMFGVIAPMVDGATQNAQPLAALTFDELVGLHETVEAMWHLAKRSRQMEVGGDLIERDEAASRLFERMEEIGIPDRMPGEGRAVTEAEERGLFLQQGLAFLRRVEQWAGRMDGAYGGPFLRYIFQPIKDAADRYRTDRMAYRRKLQALVDNIAPIVGDQVIDAPELGYTFGAPGSTKGTAMNEILHAIAHTGNESNKRKLLLGRQWATELPDGTLDTSRWDAFLARLVNEGKLEKAHFDFVQGLWDLLEETKPLAQKAHRDAFGRYFAEVTADSLVDPFGVTRRGGYVPAMVDSEIVKDNELRKLAEAENENMAFAFPQPNRGFTKSRTEYNRPLMLDLRTLGQHVDKVLLFSHMTVPARDARKLITDKKVGQTLNRVQPAAISGMLQPWLQRSAQQIVETPVIGAGKWARVPGVVRARAGMALMFANVSNTIQQVTGLSNALVLVKGGFMRRALAQYVAHPVRFAREVWATSPYMDDRARNEVAMMNEQMQDILIRPGIIQRAQSWSMRNAYFLQTALDNIISPIVWSGAYNQALADGMQQDDAVRFADGVVRQTQGSTLPEDVSRLETGPAYARVFTQFIGYFNMMANTNATAIQQIAGEVGLKKGAGRALYVVLMGLLVPIWAAEAIAQALRGGPDDEDDDGYLDDWLAAVFGFGTIKGLLAMLPIIGQAANSAVTRLDNNPLNDRISLSPGLSLLESALGGNVQTVAEILDEDKDVNARRAVRDAATLVSVFTGVPVYAAARPAGYLAGVAQGKINPTGPVDLARGLVTGAASPESKN